MFYVFGFTDSTIIDWIYYLDDAAALVFTDKNEINVLLTCWN